MSIMPLSEFSGEQDNTSNNRIMRWRERYYRQEAAIATLKAQRDELLAAAKEMSEAVALLPATDGRVLGLLPILCNLRSAIANAERPAGC